MRKCQVEDEDGEPCPNEARYQARTGRKPCCESCVRELIDQGEWDEEDFEEIGAP